MSRRYYNNSVVSLLPITLYIPALRRLTYLRGNLANFRVDFLKHTVEIAEYAANEYIFDPVRYAVKYSKHRILPK